MKTWIDAYLTSHTVPRERDADGNLVGVRVLGNGSNLFFQRNDRYLVCEVDMMAFGLVRGTISEWNSGEAIAKEERARLLPVIVRMFEKYYGQGRKADLR